MREIVWTQYGATRIEVVALAFTLLLGVVLLFVRRSRALLPIVLVAALVPHAQRVVIGGLDFSMLRILIVFGWLRIALQREYRHLRWAGLDTAICAWLLASALTYVARERTFGSLVYQLGFAFDALGIYLMARVLLRTPADIVQAIRDTCAVALLIAAFMVVEATRGRNLFSVLGGVPEITMVRDDRLRCQGAFSHPIMSGTFGATLVPLAVALWLGSRRRRGLPAAGFVAATLIMILSASSGPLFAWAGATIGWLLWFVVRRRRRTRLRAFRWAVVFVLLVLHFVREQPVWHLIGRASDLVGGEGYHRVELINAFTGHVGDWWLIGSNRMATWGWGLQDLTNEYVLWGVSGGLVTLGAFVAILVVAFSYVGRSLDRAKRAPRLSRRERKTVTLLAWGLGTALASHALGFVAVSYFGQMRALFYVFLAMIGSLQVCRELRRGGARAAVAVHAGRPGLAGAAA